MVLSGRSLLGSGQAASPAVPVRPSWPTVGRTVVAQCRFVTHGTREWAQREMLSKRVGRNEADVADAVFEGIQKGLNSRLYSVDEDLQ